MIFAASLAASGIALPRPAQGAELIAFYLASWGGLPAALVKLSLGQTDSAYSDKIQIATVGVPRWFSHFRGGAKAEGVLSEGGAAMPERYDALYDLRKRHDSRISLRFTGAEGGTLAERGPDDTTRKPPLAARLRRNVIDPVSAFAAIRHRLAIDSAKKGERFTVPVYDGARRFDVAVLVEAVGGTADVIRLHLELRPIAGFKGETSEDGDPDDAPRPVEVTLTDDSRLLPLSLEVSVAWLPLVVRFEHLCGSMAQCTETN
jgi:hypothetical protein